MSSPENKLALEEYIKTHEDCVQQETVPVLLKGSRVLLKVYSIPLEYLYFNIKNGRFKAEYLELVRKNGGKDLDPTDENDAKKIQKLLLDLDPTETRRTINDIRQRGQWQPGIMTHDGFVIDGNRRLSILLNLAKEDKKFGMMKVASLPPNVDKNDLWKLEAGIQLGKDEIVKYDPVNELLKLKEGVDAGLDLQEIAKTLYGYNETEEIEKKLDRLTLIERYLEFNGTPQKYSEAKNKFQHFVDAQNILAYAESRLKENPELRKEIRRALFGLIQDGRTYHEIRKIHGMIKYQSEKAINYLQQIAQASKPKQVEKEIRSLEKEEIEKKLEFEVEKTIDKPEEDEEKTSPIGMLWDRAIEAFKVDQNKDDIPRLLGNALDNLDALDYGNDQLKTIQCKQLIEKILRHTSKLTKILER